MKIQSKQIKSCNFSQISQLWANSAKTHFRRRSSTRLKRWSFIGACATVLTLLYLHFFTGIFYRPFEKDFCANFDYPDDIQDFPQFIQRYKFLEKSHLLNRRSLTPSNTLYSSVEFTSTAESGCSGPIGLLIIVKSATWNAEKRAAVRSTWGHTSYLRNNSISEDLPTKLVFIVGEPANESASEGLKQQEALTMESQIYTDIVSASFKDTYNNNTYKSMSALRWAKEICTNFRYLFLVDDDLFVSLPNLLLYLKSPLTFELNFSSVPKYSNNWSENQSSEYSESNPFAPELHKEKLFLGMVITSGRPFRNKYGWDSKWCVSLSDYPYNYFPSYIPGMAMVLSKPTVIDFVYASLFTRHLYIDDVYLGILAHRLKITPTHCKYFTMLNKWTNAVHWTEYMIAVHSYSPTELVRNWKNQSFDNIR